MKEIKKTLKGPVNRTFKCFLCNKTHCMFNKKFPVNKTADQLLKLNLENLSIVKIYEKTNEECAYLKSSLNEAREIITDPTHFIRNHVTKIKHRINSRRDEIKSNIDEKANDLIKELDCFETDCLYYLRTQLKENMEAFARMSDHAQSKLNEWSDSLELTFNESKWEEIKSNAFFIDNLLQGKLDELKDQLTMNKFWQYEKNCKDLVDFGSEFKLYERKNSIVYELNNFSENFNSGKETSEEYSAEYSFGDISYCAGSKIVKVNDELYLALYLICDSDLNSFQTKFPLHANIKFSILNSNDGKCSYSKTRNHCFDGSTGLGIGNFIRLKDLMNLTNGFYDTQKDRVTTKLEFFFS